MKSNTRILIFTLAAASLVAAVPALAHAASDPMAPSPDDLGTPHEKGRPVERAPLAGPCACAHVAPKPAPDRARGVPPLGYEDPDESLGAPGFRVM